MTEKRQGERAKPEGGQPERGGKRRRTEAPERGSAEGSPEEARERLHDATDDVHGVW
jgi:hypothetical protein